VYALPKAALETYFLVAGFGWVVMVVGAFGFVLQSLGETA
jgi:hypothetical protein